MATLKSLANEMKRLDKKIATAANNIAKDVAVSVLTSLVKNTPVDTSQAISNWQVGLGYANYDNIPAYFEGVYGDTESESAAAALAVGKLLIKSKKPGEDLHITNGLDYIELINEGVSSNQWPLRDPTKAHFLEKALADGEAKLKKAKLKL